MAPRTAVPALLLLVGAFCACLAQPEELSLLDVTQGSSSTKAAISSYGYGVRVERTCMSQNQVKNCRVGGCEDCYDALHFQTDFGCCDSHSDYSHPKENLVGARMPPKVSNCQWSIDLLKEFTMEKPAAPGKVTGSGGSEDDLAIVPVEEGVYIKMGTATGECTLTEASDKCEGPYCSDMKITMQGGLYASLAYSKDRGNTISIPTGDLCLPFAEGLNAINNDFSICQGVKVQLETAIQKRKADRAARCSAGTCDQPGEAVGSVAEMLNDALAHSSLPGQLEAALAPYCHHKDTIHPTVPPTPAQAASEPKLKPLAMKSDYDGGYYGDKDGVFAGFALTLMGQTTISSLKHPLKVESTGHMEYTPVFLASAKYIPMKEDWPTVIGGAMKLWFKSQEEVHEPEYKGHSKYRE